MDGSNRPSSMVIVKQELEQIAAASRPVGTLLSTYNHHRLVLALAWSPDGAYIVSSTANSVLHVFDPTTGAQLYTYRYPFINNTWKAFLPWRPGRVVMTCRSDVRTEQAWHVE